MRHIIISAVIALILMLPLLAEQYGWDLAGKNLLAIPATGFAYMGVFFHEIGHAIASWFYGYPAIPTFDFQHGGGMTYWGARSHVLLGCACLLLITGMVYLYRGGYWMLLGILSFLLVFQLGTAFNTGHDVVMSYMGHGGEILIAYFCLLRGGMGNAAGLTQTERYFDLIFGFFTLARNVLMSVALQDASGRADYEMQKGGHMMGDFSKIAEYTGMNLGTVALASLAFMLLLAVPAGYVAMTLRRENM